MKREISRMLMVLVIIQGFAWSFAINIYGVEIKSDLTTNLIRTNSRSLLSLNGQWLTNKHKGLKFVYPPPKDGWKTQSVPHGKAKFIKYDYKLTRLSVSALKKKGVTNFDDREDISSWYKKIFRLPPQKIQGKAYLCFKALPFKSEIWLNGKKIGENIIGLVPKSYEVSKLLHFGGDNEIVIGLSNQCGLIDFENETYLAPFNNTHNAAIAGDVLLEFVPNVFIDDVFIKTSVAEKMIELEVTVRNLSDQDQKLTPECTIIDSQTMSPQIKFKGDFVIVGKNSSKVLRVKKQWMPPVLWSPETPKLYIADVSVSSDKSIIDQFKLRFGFREFKIKGRQFQLNGKRITMYRKSINADLRRDYKDVYANVDDVRDTAKRNIGNPYNDYRIWGNNPLISMMGDEIGITSSQRLAGFIPKYFPVDKKDIWLPNLLKHMKGVIKQLRNSPSIVIWNMTNENYWGKVPGDSKMKSICGKIVKLVRETDDTRPLDGDAEVGWAGLLDIISIHYPGMPGVLSEKYGNAGPVVPNDMYWLKDKGVNSSWRAKFVWNKPLSLGEYWHLGGKVNNWVNFTGEDIFDWIKYSSSDKRGRDGRPGNPFVKTLKMLTDYYRMRGVASLNPWYIGTGMDVMPPVAVRPMDFHPNFYGGEFLTRKLAVFNDTSRSYPRAHLQYLLKTGKRPIAEGKIKISCVGGERKEHLLRIPLPKVGKPMKATLTVRLCYYAGGGRHEVYHYDENVYIMPKTTLKDIPQGQIVLLDPNQSAANALKSLALDSVSLKKLSSGSLENKKLLIIAPDTDTSPWKNIIASFVENGGRALFLKQKQFSAAVRLSLPETDLAHITSRAWKRCYNHPITQGLKNEQFSFWMPNNIVAEYSMLKPSNGDMDIILDSTGIRGFAWTPLAEKPLGKGVMLFSQLNLVSGAETEPMCSFLLKRMVNYALNYKPATSAPLRFIGKKDSGMKMILKEATIKYTEGLEGTGPILIDDATALTTEKKKRIRSFVENGGKVWVRCPSPQALSNLKGVLPALPQMKPLSKKIKSCVRISDSLFLNNISSEEFFWVNLNLVDRMDYFGNGKSTAPLGKYEIVFPSLTQAEPLIAPGLLVNYPLGKGNFILDAFDWRKAFETENMKVIRIINALGRNLGAEVAVKKQIAWDHTLMDLSKAANMGYVDEYQDDGKGGWLDMGKADLCFFLINHTGLSNGVGAPVAVPPFPERYRFLGVPFKLTAPKKNNGNAIIALRGKTHSVKMPDQVAGIAANAKADKIWFLHSATYVPQKAGVVIAKYVLRYADGSQAVFPVRSGIEIGNWCGPVRQKAAQVAWAGRNRPGLNVGIYLTSWTNPFPEKIIKSIDVVSGFSDAAIAVLGITLGRLSAGDDNELKTVTNWDFRKNDSGFPACFRPPGRLWPKDDSSPKHEIIFKENGVHLSGKQYLSGNFKNIPLYPADAIELETEFSITKPLGKNYSYGLFQAMNYKKSGFRVHITKQMRISLEMFPSKKEWVFLKSSSQLQLGRDYKLQIKMDGKTASIFINGKLDAMKSSSLPAPCKKGNLLIGHCSGAGYFEGVIKSLSLLKREKNERKEKK